MAAVIRSVPGVCEVEFVRGAAAAADATPDVLFEVSHGATLARHFDDLRAQLRGEYSAGLKDFFFVNTDVGAPELAAAIARLVVASQPRRSCLVLRCLLPRTFVDCNRRIDRDGATTPGAGQMTPGLPPWVTDESDHRLLLELHNAYRDVAAAAFEKTCGAGGFGICVHTYAPRSVDVPIDDKIGEHMRAAYAADRVSSWPLRAAFDLITHDPAGREIASPRLARAAEAELGAAGFEVVRNNAYSLHEVTLAHEFATRHRGQTLCFEARRDLLVPEFTPFREMTPDPARVARAAAPLSAAILATLEVRT